MRGDQITHVLGCGHHINRIDCYAGSWYCFFIIQWVSFSRETLLITRNVDKITVLLTKWDSIKFYNTLNPNIRGFQFLLQLINSLEVLTPTLITKTANHTKKKTLLRRIRELKSLSKLLF